MTQKELKNFAPTLANMQKKKTGFKVPASYFDTVEASIINEMGPKSLPKKTGLNLPNDYFDSIEEKVLVRLKGKTNKDEIKTETKFESFDDIVIAPVEKEEKPRLVNLKKYIIPLAVAASLALLITIFNPFAKYSKSDISEIALWIEDGNLDLDSYEIAEYLNSESESLELESSINTESLENYLLEEVSEESFYN